jgi:hypothetical protein
VSPPITIQTALAQPRKDALSQTDEIEREILAYAAGLDDSMQRVCARLFTKISDVRTLIRWSEAEQSAVLAELFLTHAEAELQAVTFEFLDFKILLEHSRP